MADAYSGVYSNILHVYFDEEARLWRGEAHESYPILGGVGCTGHIP